MVTQVNAIMKAQKNLLITLQDFIVFSFFLEFSHSVDFLCYQKVKCLFFFNIDVSEHTYFVYCATALMFAEPEERENHVAGESAASQRWLDASSLPFGPAVV